MACECNLTLKNTGKPGCVPLIKAIRKIIVVPYYDNTGAVNYIDTTTTLNAAYFSGKINQTDASKRWYPLPELKNVTSDKADSVFEEYEDGSKDFIREGVRSFTGLMTNETPTFLGKIKGYRCYSIGIFVIDKDGNLIGMYKETNKLYPILIDNSSWDPRYVMATDPQVAKVSLSFDWHIDEKDEDMRMISSSEVSPVNLLSLSGIIDVNSTITNITTTGFKAKLTTDYGTPITALVVKGLVAGDFALAEVSPTPGAITITSVTESPEGTYTFVIPAQTSADVLKLTPTKTGYDFTNVIATTITIP